MKPFADIYRSLRNWSLSFFGFVWCDRCCRPVEGQLGRGVSYGVYVGWEEYCVSGEKVICDQCMWQDERFLAVYPSMRRATRAKFLCTRCGKNEVEVREAGCERGPCPMELS